MTPDQHREQAARLRRSEDVEALRRATLHDQLAVAIEQRELQGHVATGDREE